MTPGSKVRHREYGDGTVVEISSHHGVKVDFGYESIWILDDDVAVAGEEPRPPRQTASDGQTPRQRILDIQPDVIKARRSILALKLGQVLEEDVCHLSVGVEDIQDTLRQAVASAIGGRPQSILVEGAWGTGKTHLLTLLTALAARAGLATSTVILDGEGVSLSDPMGLMEAILGSLRYPGEVVARGIGSRLSILRGQALRLRRHVNSRIVDALLAVPSQTFQDPEAVEVLEDYFIMKTPAYHARAQLKKLLRRRIRLPSIGARNIVDRPGRFFELLMGWAACCASTNAAKGLVVIFDELDAEWAMATRQERRDSLLNKLAELNGNNTCPLLLAFGSAPGSDVDTIDPVRDVLTHIPWTNHIEARTPSSEQTKELGQRLQKLYESAYPDRLASADQIMVQRWINDFADRHLGELDPTPRAFVRGTLERLDLWLELGGRDEHP